MLAPGPSQTSLIDKIMRCLSWINLAQSEEGIFLKDLEAKDRPQCRLLYMIGMAFEILHIGYDYAMAPQYFWTFLAIRLVTCAVIGLVVLFSHLASYRNFVHLKCLVFFILTNSIVLMVAILNEDGDSTAYAYSTGITLVIDVAGCLILWQPATFIAGLSSTALGSAITIALFNSHRGPAIVVVASIALTSAAFTTLAVILGYNAARADFSNRHTIDLQKIKLQEVLDNIDQGILTINSELRIEDDFSRFLTTFYGVHKHQFTDDDLLSTIFPHCELSSERLDKCRQTLQMILGEDKLNWTLNSPHLITEAAISTPDGRKVIALDWSPIIDAKNEVVIKVLLSIRDQTQSISLKHAVNEARSKKDQRLLTISHMAHLPRRSLQLFFEDMTPRLKALKSAEHRRRLAAADQEAIIFTSRTLHTIKGAARMTHFSDISEACHRCESSLHGVNRTANLSTAYHTYFADFEHLSAAFAELITIFHSVLGGRLAVSPPNTATQSVHLESLSVPSPQQRTSLTDIVSHLRRPLSTMLKDAGLSLKYFACKDAVITWKTAPLMEIGHAIMHALTNAADHGYILPARAGHVRRDAWLEVSSRMDNAAVTIEIRDQGIGLSHEKIVALANTKGFLPRPGGSVYDVLFEDGASTAASVSLTSGRGVGLSAIKSIVHQLEGEVYLAPRSSGGSKLVMLLPATSVCLGHHAQRGLDVA